jgi:nicotinate-nucleotide pyrophosphorylase (carboxylating)
MSLRGRWDDVGTFLVQNSQLYIIIEHTSTLCYISGVKTQVEPKLKFFDNAALLHLNNPTYKKCVLELFNWLLFNDKVENDKTSKLLFAEKSLKKAKARIFPRQEIIVAGLEEIAFLLDHLTNLKYKIKSKDGQKIKQNEILLEIIGAPTEILSYERTILNILQRLSGIATKTQQQVTFLNSLKLRKTPRIAATRKTIWSYLDKKAVSVGGGLTHRLSLADGVLVKDNQLMLLKELYDMKKEKEMAVKALEILLEKENNSLFEIEVEKKESFINLIKLFTSHKTDNVLGIMLDNFDPLSAKNAILEVKNYPLSHIAFEVSGGITADNLPLWADSGADFISLGALTHSVQAVDISLDIF